VCGTGAWSRQLSHPFVCISGVQMLGGGAQQPQSRRMISRASIDLQSGERGERDRTRALERENETENRDVRARMLGQRGRFPQMRSLYKRNCSATA